MRVKWNVGASIVYAVLGEEWMSFKLFISSPICSSQSHFPSLPFFESPSLLYFLLYIPYLLLSTTFSQITTDIWWLVIFKVFIHHVSALYQEKSYSTSQTSFHLCLWLHFANLSNAVTKNVSSPENNSGRLRWLLLSLFLSLSFPQFLLSVSTVSTVSMLSVPSARYVELVSIAGGCCEIIMSPLSSLHFKFTYVSNLRRGLLQESRGPLITLWLNKLPKCHLKHCFLCLARMCVIFGYIFVRSFLSFTRCL